MHRGCQYRTTTSRLGIWERGCSKSLCSSSCLRLLHRWSLRLLALACNQRSGAHCAVSGAVAQRRWSGVLRLDWQWRDSSSSCVVSLCVCVWATGRTGARRRRTARSDGGPQRSKPPPPPTWATLMTRRSRASRPTTFRQSGARLRTIDGDTPATEVGSHTHNHYEGQSKSFAIQYDRLNVDKFKLSQMLPTHMSSVVSKNNFNVFINYCMAYGKMTSPTENDWNF